MAVRGINKVILVGRLGKDPEVRYIPNGGAVANLQVATSESWRTNRRGRCGSRRNGIAWCCSASSRKWLVNICVRVRRSTSRGNSVPVAGTTTTASPVTSLKSLLKTRAPCRCWDVPQVLRLSRKRRTSSAVSLSRNHSRNRKKVARKRKAVDVRPRSRSLSSRLNPRMTSMTTFRSNERRDNRPVQCGASPENEDERIFQNISGAA